MSFLQSTDQPVVHLIVRGAQVPKFLDVQVFQRRHFALLSRLLGVEGGMVKVMAASAGVSVPEGAVVAGKRAGCWKASILRI